MLYDKRWEQKPKLKAWQQILLDAADLLERHGWCQEKYEGKDGSHCALGAILAARGNQATHTAESHLFMAIGSIADWNDHPDRTAAEVVATLRAVAKAYR